MVFLLPAWANRPKEYKKGGRVKKDKEKEEVKKKSKKKSEKDSGLSQSVNVNIKIGDSVLLHKGNVPKTNERKAKGYTPTGNPIGRPKGSGYKGAPLRGPSGGPEGPLSYGVLPGGGNPPVKRFVSPGNSYGAMPGPLQVGYYGSAPNVANPTSVFPYAGSGSALWNYNRNKNDDVPQIVNPSDIKPITNPSITFDRGQASRGISMSRPGGETAGAGASRFPFVGDIPRLNEPNLLPSKNAVPPFKSAMSRESSISSVFDSAESGAGLSKEEADIMYGTSGGRRLSAQEAAMNRMGSVFDVPATAAVSSPKIVELMKKPGIARPVVSASSSLAEASAPVLKMKKPGVAPKSRLMQSFESLLNAD
jgi:hypothetical protein